MIHSDDVFRRTDRLYIMARRHNISACLAEDLQIIFDFLLNLLHATEGSSVLIVYATMKDDIFTKIVFQPFSIHPFTEPLDRIQDIDPQIYHVGDDIPHCTIVVVKDTNSGGMGKIDNPFHPRQQKFPNVI